MRILLRRDVDKLITMLSDMQITILLEDRAMNQDLRMELTAKIRDLTKAIGGKNGSGKYANNLLDKYFMRGGEILPTRR